MQNINKSRVSLLSMLKCDRPSIAQGYKYLCDYGTNNFNPIWPGIKSEIIQATEGFCPYLKK
jgi:hypothetical protein